MTGISQQATIGGSHDGKLRFQAQQEVCDVPRGPSGPTKVSSLAGKKRDEKQLCLRSLGHVGAISKLFAPSSRAMLCVRAPPGRMHDGCHAILFGKVATLRLAVHAMLAGSSSTASAT